MKIEIVRVDYLSEKHALEMAFLMNQYAVDPMGGGKPFTDQVHNNLAMELSKLPHAFSLISYVDDVAVGLINCFEMFSTFSCQPLINIHDLIVLKQYRGKGLSQKMLRQVEEIAVAKGCCKLTLEVLEGNKIAKASYNKFGFSNYQLDPAMGSALFWQKKLE